MATALVDAASPSSRARNQAGQFSRHDEGLPREVGGSPETLQATEEMCAYCFASTCCHCDRHRCVTVTHACLQPTRDVIIAHFNDIEPPPPAFSTSNVCGMFVTWDKHEQGVQNLRGCIGTLTPMAISSLKDYTYSSALNDRRFSPIEASELDALDVSVSLLLKYESARHWEDWEVGVHGIVINFSDDRGSSYSATFLPEVAAEQGWSRRVTLTRLVRKAGYKRAVDAAFLSRVQVTRYQSSKCKLSYQEYLDMRRLA